MLLNIEEQSCSSLTQETIMFTRKSMFALATLTTVATAALAPTGASAWGHGGGFGGNHGGFGGYRGGYGGWNHSGYRGWNWNYRNYGFYRPSYWHNYSYYPTVYSAPSYSAPSYSAPSAPVYSAPSAPVYSAPSAHVVVEQHVEVN